MNKRCFTLTSCQFEKHCALAHTPHSQVTLWFSPEHTGEACHHYIAMPKESNEDAITRLAGALS